MKTKYYFFLQEPQLARLMEKKNEKDESVPAQILDNVNILNIIFYNKTIKNIYFITFHLNFFLNCLFLI